MPDKISLKEIFDSASVQLACAGVDNPLLNVRVLAGHALGLAPTDVSKHLNRVLTQKEKDSIAELIKRRSRRETLNRIIGKSEFCGSWFFTNEATLEPRPESETIVRYITKKVKKFPWFLPSRKPLRVLDLGTGSGCILLSFLRALPNATGLGIDIAPRAVEQARQNADRLGLEARAEFRINDWAVGLEEKFDIISFNPPYIPMADMPLLMPAVRDFDPVLALHGGTDGMDPYRIVVPLLPKLLRQGGYAGIEMGENQTQEIGQLLKAADFTDISLLIDFRGFDRVFVVRQKSEEAHRRFVPW